MVRKLYACILSGLLSLMLFQTHQLSAGENGTTGYSLKGSNPGYKNRIWISWGYNRSFYSRSDIAFVGNGYDFTLHKMAAKDRPTPFDASIYCNPLKLTIPQFNGRIGWFLNDEWSLSLGTDHMKYIVYNYQSCEISGSIDTTISGKYAGVYDHTPMIFTYDFGRFEHTNGLNYIDADIDYYRRLATWRKLGVDVLAGGGAGILYPRTDAGLFSIDGINIFHVAGWGTALKAGARLNLGSWFFIQLEWKGGYIHMPDIITLDMNSRARQQFMFGEGILSTGFSFNYFNRKKTTD